MIFFSGVPSSKSHELLDTFSTTMFAVDVSYTAVNGRLMLEAESLRKGCQPSTVQVTWFLVCRSVLHSSWKVSWPAIVIVCVTLRVAVSPGRS